MNDEMKEFNKILDNKTEVLLEKSKKFSENTNNAIRQYATWGVSVILILAIILLNFVPVDFDPFLKLREFTTNTVLLILCTFLFALNMGDYGRRMGYTNSNYKAALKNYIILKNELEENQNILLLSKFCSDWTKEKLIYDRTDELNKANISYEDYIKKGYNKLSNSELGVGKLTHKELIIFNILSEKIQNEISLSPKEQKQYEKFSAMKHNSLGLSDMEIKAIINANSIGLKILSSDRMLEIGKQKNNKNKTADQQAIEEAPVNETKKSNIVMAIRIILNSIFAGGIVVSAAITGGLAAWALCILKIAIMCATAFSKYLKEYSRIAEKMTTHIETITSYLKSFKKWCEKS